jgi:NAD(P)-dependent dehydrogenase (short-subunit alcohol dehydrogenase family)
MIKEFWTNKNILITGGTSGLGRELALTLSRLGAHVAVVARGNQALEALEAIEPRIVTIKGDVSRKDLVYSIASEVQSRLGSVDVLFHNASYLGVTPLRLLVDTDCEDFEAVLQTNLLGPFRLTKVMISDMILKRQGVIVNITSDAAVQAYPGWGTYSVSKAALDHLTRVFNAELNKYNIQFLAIDPGDMNTPMHMAAQPTADATLLRSPKESAEKIISHLEQNHSFPERVQI